LGVDNELLLLNTAVECELLAPKGKWRTIVDKVANYVSDLELRIVELEKIQHMRVIDSFPEKKDV
jgi:hypothetical protein